MNCEALNQIYPLDTSINYQMACQEVACFSLAYTVDPDTLNFGFANEQFVSVEPYDPKLQTGCLQSICTQSNYPEIMIESHEREAYQDGFDNTSSWQHTANSVFSFPNIASSVQATSFYPTPASSSPSTPDYLPSTLSFFCPDQFSACSEETGNQDVLYSSLDLYDPNHNINSTNISRSNINNKNNIYPDTRTPIYFSDPSLASYSSPDSFLSPVSVPTTVSVLPTVSKPSPPPPPPPSVVIKVEDVQEPKKTKDRPFGCEDCKRAFTRRHDLERHKRVHTGVQPYECPHCLRKFSRTDARQRHWKLEKECAESVKVNSLLANRYRKILK